MVDSRKVYGKFSEILSDSLNAAAEIFAEDIRAQVPVATGRLRAGYRPTQKAEPGNLKIQIGPSQKYGAKFYPFTQNFGRRQAQRPARVRFFGGDEQIYEDRRVTAVREQVSARLKRWNNGR